jgi:hypothetical protein
VCDNRPDGEIWEVRDSDGAGVALELISEVDEMFGDRVKWDVADGHDETLKELSGLCVTDALPETDWTTDSDVRLDALRLTAPLALGDADAVVDTLCVAVFVGVVVVDDVIVPGSTLVEGVTPLVCEPVDVAIAVCSAEFVNVYVESGDDDEVNSLLNDTLAEELTKGDKETTDECVPLFDWLTVEDSDDDIVALGSEETVILVVPVNDADSESLTVTEVTPLDDGEAKIERLW